MQSLDGARRRLLPSTYCPFCTDGHISPVVPERDATDPFSLSHLLPAGTIPVTVHHGDSPCSSTSNDHDWHFLFPPSSSNHPVGALFEELAFLSNNSFLRATCRLGSSSRIVFIRIYLIPNDLPNVHGKLHRRSETVFKKARSHLASIIPLIERNHDLWEAYEAGLNVPQEHLLPCDIDNRTMAEIYSDLPSPVLCPPINENTRLSHCIASGDAIWGLRSPLYNYQRHSVAVMLHRESSTSPAPDPLYISVSSMSGVHFYIRPSTMTILQECPMSFPSRAGILCEELGSGKTIMIIALILATASQLADPEECMVKRLVMTPLAYRYFPSTEHAHARQKANLRHKSIHQVPSLVELLIDYFSSVKPITGRPVFASKLEACHLWPFIQVNKAFYHHYRSECLQDGSRRSNRQVMLDQGPRTMYLSSATLVVVPLPLLGQWKTEIDKHCHDYVRYLIVRPSMELPDARELASDYELVVMSITRFCVESRKNKVDKLHRLKPCACPCLAGSRVPNCCCPGDPEVTPLLQVRWKRLIIDEGHNTGNDAAVTNHFAKQLSIQHKWIVTGTPTSNILGLQLGRTADDELDLIYPDFDPLVATSSSQDEGCHVRIWGNYERLNLRKLGIMIGDFLAVHQLHANSDYFKQHVSIPLCDQHGPQLGSINVLSQVMQTVMVRHRIEDVEKDILLPPMRHDIVYMNLDSYAQKSYNAMQAALAINAIDSEREGTDYLFHPSKAKDLQITINNSSQGLFWSASDILYNVDQICDLADEYLARAVRRQVGPEEIDLLQQALKHAAAAAQDELWRAMQPHADVPFKVSGLDPAVLEAWTRSGLCDSSRTIDVMHPDRLVNLRTVVRTNPLISKAELIEEGDILDLDEDTIMCSKPVSSHKAKCGADRTKQMVKEVQGTIQALKNRVERMHASDSEGLQGCQDGDGVVRVCSAKAAAARVTCQSSPLSGVKVGPSLSTKLNYVLSEVQQYSAKEKFLIFSNSLLTLFQIGEALSLFEIKYLRYTNQEHYQLREQCITTFETSDVHRVLLMELKLGARGLNLISASRIIFCEPVWHPDVESQAIKRAHRIGQTRRVTVKTLVIRSTAEEAMIARRQYLRTSDKVPSMTTESGMRDYLQNPRFLTEPASPDDSLNVVLSLDGHQEASVDMQSSSCESYEGSSSRVDVDSDILINESEDQIGDAIARKRVRFEA